LNHWRASRNIIPVAMPDAAKNFGEPNLDEPLLVLRCQLGDEPAFTELIRRYGPRIHYYLKKMLGNPDRTDDALQELWIDVFRSLPKLREPAAFRGWLYRLARDRAFRTIRSAKPPPQDLADIEIADESDNDDETFSPEDAAMIHQTLDKLVPEHREVLLLRFVESMSYTQIASVVGCELGTVRSRIFYAKRALKEKLERNPHANAINTPAPERFRLPTH
jgi:RNA polymerase sigma-70 factor (ECF subfamily)